MTGPQREACPWACGNWFDIDHDRGDRAQVCDRCRRAFVVSLTPSHARLVETRRIRAND